MEARVVVVGAACLTNYREWVVWVVPGLQKYLTAARFSWQASLMNYAADTAALSGVKFLLRCREFASVVCSAHCLHLLLCDRTSIDINAFQVRCVCVCVFKYSCLTKKGRTCGVNCPACWDFITFIKFACHDGVHCVTIYEGTSSRGVLSHTHMKPNAHAGLTTWICCL